MRLLTRFLFFVFLFAQTLLATESLETLAHKALEHKTVSTIQWQGKKVWIKGVAADKSTRVYCWKRQLLYYIAPLDVLKPTPTCGLDQLNLEKRRLIEFHERGVPAPQIVGHGGEWLALSDVGQNLHTYLAKQSPAQQTVLIQKALTALISLHQKNAVHGRGMIKDFAYDPKTQTMSFIDLSEDPLSWMTLDQAKARDFMMFLFSVKSFSELGDNFLKGLFDQYCAQSSEGVRQEIQRTYKFLKPFYKVADFFYAYIGVDGQRFCLLMGDLGQFLKKE